MNFSYMEGTAYFSEQSGNRKKVIEWKKFNFVESESVMTDKISCHVDNIFISAVQSEANRSFASIPSPRQWDNTMMKIGGSRE